ncbi:Imm41 family immunity protein [Campylobacter ureolyticus]|uniref:Imm41 family immunity protein n=1 Tax=Campylobacter ureolyticus TaxID=827 RepID=A0A9Q4KTJ0_9BACT|nr:Imm41 family immunity protein [Campylobacter ureolyticus]MCZ6104413.1 Imm41 family immunity protein [Campylobacter ureolyticus]MCZ6162544.1 Imm41 family immunity protein [Campylobacter ureolyticus]MCZ6171545.1 Imm41 family immunity protein [Campylobacter ureolyticus]
MDDKEYWKLENNLIHIFKKYKNKPLPKDIIQGLIWILNGNLYTHGAGFATLKTKILKNSKKYFTPILAPTADDRLKRLKNTDTLYRL